MPEDGKATARTLQSHLAEVDLEHSKPGSRLDIGPIRFRLQHSEIRP